MPILALALSLVRPGARDDGQLRQVQARHHSNARVSETGRATEAAVPVVPASEGHASRRAGARLHDVADDFDDTKIPSAAGTPEDLLPETSEPKPQDEPGDHVGAFVIQQQIKTSIEPLLALSAAIQQQTKTSNEPLLAVSAAIQQQTKLAIEPLLAIQQQTKLAIEPLLAISAVAQQQISAFAAATDLWANFDLSAVRLPAWTKKYDEIFNQIAEVTAFKLPELDHWIRDLDRWIPSNLRDVQGLDIVFSVALEEGIPLSWVPRPAIVTELMEADGPQERLRVFAERRDDILDDCDDALAQMSHEWATQCRNAIRALRAGLCGAAQSHAANIIDSVVLRLGGNRARQVAVKLAQRDMDDLPFRLTAETLTRRPLARALTRWQPNAGTPPPAHFSRHATSHAVGHPGVFRPEYALTAIMLATSLIVQFEVHLRSDKGSTTSNNNN